MTSIMRKKAKQWDVGGVRGKLLRERDIRKGCVQVTFALRRDQSEGGSHNKIQKRYKVEETARSKTLGGGGMRHRNRGRKGRPVI